MRYHCRGLPVVHRKQDVDDQHLWVREPGKYIDEAEEAIHAQTHGQTHVHPRDEVVSVVALAAQAAVHFISIFV